jgi:mono/diheme cytochrome c family protein
MKEIALALPPRWAIHRVMLPVVLVAAPVLGAGCYPKAGPPPVALSANSIASASTRWSGVTASSLSKGHDLFLANCDVCHGYPDLTAIPDERWPNILEKMAKKSHLDAEERDAILHFVLASRSEQGAR